MNDERLVEAARQHPYPLVFATVSGAHLYGFASADSDFDLRGPHVLPVREVVGLGRPRETVTLEEQREGFELDLVTHDIRKFIALLLKPNGYVLEQLYSPLVVTAGPDHEELKALARGCTTRHHAHHYRGFAHGQARQLEGEDPPRVKTVLYLYRVLLTGIHLLSTGDVEANLPRLLQARPVAGVDELIARKAAGPEKGGLAPEELAAHLARVAELHTALDEAERRSSLPDAPTSRAALDDFLVGLRLRA